MLSALHSQCFARLSVAKSHKDEGDLVDTEQEEKHSSERPHYIAYALCRALNQIVWVSEVGGLYKCIEGNGGEVKREQEIILKRLCFLQLIMWTKAIGSSDKIFCRFAESIVV